MLARSSSPETWIIGIDDTDMPGIGGTGRLARLVAAEIDRAGLGVAAGVTRHQFFEGPGVPKTKRNSAAAIAFDGVRVPAELFETVCAVVLRESVEGSDPGVGMVTGPVSSELVAFARRAQATLVDQVDARRLAASAGIGLAGLGGTEDGVIGALAAAVLRTEGHDGRFVGLPGIRDVSGKLTVADLLHRTGISGVVDGEQQALEPATVIDVGDWVRPRLVGGEPVIVARRKKIGWVNADRRR